MDYHNTSTAAASLLCVDGEDILAKLRDSPPVSANPSNTAPSQSITNQHAGGGVSLLHGTASSVGSGSFVRESSSFGPAALEHTQSGIDPKALESSSPSAQQAAAAAAAALEEEEMIEDISLKNLVIDVKHNDNYMMDADDAPTKSRSDMQNGGSLADEPTHECTAHKKQRKERFLQQDAATGEWNCREGATCKAASSESKREKKRNAAAVAVAAGAGSSMMSYGDASNLSNVSTSLLAAAGAAGMHGGNLSQPLAGRAPSFGQVNGQHQQQTMFLCSVHRKMRSARNMAFANGTWMCLPHMQCQLPTNERAAYPQPQLAPPQLLHHQLHMMNPHQGGGSHNSTSFVSQSEVPMDVPIMYTTGGGHASNSVSGSQSFHRSAPPPSYIHPSQQQFVSQHPGQPQPGGYVQPQYIVQQQPQSHPSQQQQPHVLGQQPTPQQPHHQQVVYVLSQGQQPYMGSTTPVGPNTSFPATSPDPFNSGPPLPPQFTVSGYTPQQPQQSQQQVVYVIQQPNSPSGSTPPQHHQQQHQALPQQPIYLTPAAIQQHSSGGSSLSAQSSLVYQSSSGSDAFSMYSPQSTTHHQHHHQLPTSSMLQNNNSPQHQHGLLQQQPQIGQPQQQVYWVQ